jgi:transposase
MIRDDFLSAEERVALKAVIGHPSEIHGVARRANAILLLDKGWSCAEIAEAFFLDDDTVRTWHKHYGAGGLDELVLFDWHGRPGHLSQAQEVELSTALEERLCRDSGEVAAHIRATYGVTYSHAGCIALMHRLGFEYKRPKGLPAQADEAKQATFIEGYEKLLRGLADDEAVYFVDAVHPQYQSRPAHGWVKKGDKVALRRTSGRQRINLHGALNLENFHCPLVQAEKINAASTIALFEKLEASNLDKRWIYVFADNARYHHARLVRQWLERPGCRIKLIFQPAYAPHLNAIERLWGVMHREVTHNSFYATFALFTDAIDDFFTRRLPREWKIWRDTVTDNFRIISHREFRVLE